MLIDLRTAAAALALTPELLRALPWVVAHQGGWDELLMFGLPVVLAVLAVRWADRRAKARRDEAVATEPEETGAE